MLVLSRRKDETIWIGQDVQVTILEIRGSVVKLGFTAPPEVAIRRSELSALGKDVPPPAVGIEAPTGLLAVVEATMG